MAGGTPWPATHSALASFCGVRAAALLWAGLVEESTGGAWARCCVRPAGSLRVLYLHTSAALRCAAELITWRLPWEGQVNPWQARAAAAAQRAASPALPLHLLLPDV